MQIAKIKLTTNATLAYSFNSLNWFNINQSIVGLYLI